VMYGMGEDTRPLEGTWGFGGGDWYRKKTEVIGTEDMDIVVQADPAEFRIYREWWGVTGEGDYEGEGVAGSGAGDYDGEGDYEGEAMDQLKRAIPNDRIEVTDDGSSDGSGDGSANVRVGKRLRSVNSMVGPPAPTNLY